MLHIMNETLFTGYNEFSLDWTYIIAILFGTLVIISIIRLILYMSRRRRVSDLYFHDPVLSRLRQPGDRPTPVTNKLIRQFVHNERFNPTSP